MIVALTTVKIDPGLTAHKISSIFVVRATIIFIKVSDCSADVHKETSYEEEEEEEEEEDEEEEEKEEKEEKEEEVIIS